MRIATLLFVFCLCGVARATGAGLADIDRQIGRLPELKSAHPEYGLLVFGADAARRVWLVRDGDMLYVDRNANGDLTEEGERVAAEKERSPEEGVYTFKAGDIPAGEWTHKGLSVTWRKIPPDASLNTAEFLKSHPDGRGVSVQIDMELPGKRGSGIDGRVTHAAIMDDANGVLQFADKPANAPILHFGGAWQVTLGGREEWRVGRAREVYLVVGTPGVGPGTTVCVEYQGVLPAGLTPELKIAFPTAGGGTLQQADELTRRCCLVNLYGDVRVPDAAIAGKAIVEISLESAPGAFIAPSRHEITILPPTPGPKLEPVSARLKSKLQHPNRKTSIVNIHFSPDGKRLLAGDYPGGVVQVWDLTTGKPAQAFSTGESYRSSFEYFHVAPDWKTLYAPSVRQAKFERFERDGKKVNRVTYEDSIHVWDLNTGATRADLIQSPRRSARALDLSPNGAYFLTADDAPGEFDLQRPRALSLWDVQTGAVRQVASGNANVMGISTDGKLVAIMLPTEEDNYSRAIGVYSLPDWKEQQLIAAPSKLTNFGNCVFADEGRIVIGAVNVYEKAGDWNNSKNSLKFWDVATGKELYSLQGEKAHEQYASPTMSPDGRTLAVNRYTWPRTDETIQLNLIRVADHTTKSLELSSASVLHVTFHPSGRWLVAATQVFPKDSGRRDPDVEELPQPRLHVIDVATAKIVETWVAPQTYLMSLAFSPDGTTLATSGPGEVLLWDFTAIPEIPATASISK